MRKKMISLMMTVAMGTVMISGATVVKAVSYTHLTLPTNSLV